NPKNSRKIESARGVLHPGDLIWVHSPPRWLRRRAWGGPGEKITKMVLDQRPIFEGTLFTYDHHSGYVLTMIGGLDYDRSNYNRVVQACRQPASAFKPFYYSLALDNPTLSMATILQDKAHTPEPGETWNPQNVHGTLSGEVTMHYALVKSLNLASIDLLRQVGFKETSRWARHLGLSTIDPKQAEKVKWGLALGTQCVRMDEMGRAFATFARGGSQRDPVYIRQIRDRSGQLIEDHTVPEDPLLSEDDRLDRIWATALPAPRQVIDSTTAYLMTKLLRDSVVHGIAARCQIVPVPTAGKGGTSGKRQDGHARVWDLWFVGFTSQWTAVAWVGDDKNRSLGQEEGSYTAAIPMWANFMKQAVGKRPHKELPASSSKGLRATQIDFATGKAPQAGHKSVTIYYRPGSFTPPVAKAAGPG
ncbi:MAG: hypothetical protein JRH20_23675, partial [Deltaproteobacteria bacterium]|nr:hypothetical protein [Deltaproteobacteria bacterium]